MKPSINVVIKLPGMKPERMNVENSLRALQKIVDGHIEVVQIFEDVLVICNEEGRINGMKFNCNILGAQFFGPVIICGTSGAEFEDAPEGAEQWIWKGGK